MMGGKRFIILTSFIIYSKNKNVVVFFLCLFVPSSISVQTGRCEIVISPSKTECHLLLQWSHPLVRALARVRQCGLWRIPMQ